MGEKITPERWEQVKGVFDEALEREPSQRPGFVAAACQDDEDLRRQVEDLLANEEAAQGFLERPAMRLPEMDLGAAPSRLVFAPEHVISGRFRIIQHLASGG